MFLDIVLSSLPWLCPPAVPAPAAPHPQVIRWPGGSVVVNGPEVIVRTPGTGSSTVITGSGNGVGNRIVVSNGNAGGTTVIRNARNGFGNRIILDPDDDVIELPPAAATPATYRGQAARFWTEKAWSDAFDCHLYWSPADKAWYRYHRETDCYRAVVGSP